MKAQLELAIIFNAETKIKSQIFIEYKHTVQWCADTLHWIYYFYVKESKFTRLYKFEFIPL